jgi:hypothetical protein
MVVVPMKIAVFLAVMQCGLVDVHQHLEEHIASIFMAEECVFQLLDVSVIYICRLIHMFFCSEDEIYLSKTLVKFY